jgi:ABC-type uncharacterized transport system involved in gliding motility auxiliary subunit
MFAWFPGSSTCNCGNAGNQRRRLSPKVHSAFLFLDQIPEYQKGELLLIYEQYHSIDAHDHLHNESALYRGLNQVSNSVL